MPRFTLFELTLQQGLPCLTPNLEQGLLFPFFVLYCCHFLKEEKMKQGFLKTLQAALLLGFVLASLSPVYGDPYAERTERRKEHWRKWEERWLRAPHRRHTDSSPMAAVSRRETPERQKEFKGRCVAWEKRWLNTPHRRHTDSGALRTASSTQVK